MFSYLSFFLGWMPPLLVDLLTMSSEVFLLYLFCKFLKFGWDMLPIA